jgi:hypothetical protein
LRRLLQIELLRSGSDVRRSRDGELRCTGSVLLRSRRELLPVELLQAEVLQAKVPQGEVLQEPLPQELLRSGL